MQIIPVINCLNLDCVKEKMAQISEIGCDWVHIDVSDGKFSPVETWDKSGKTEDFKSLVENFNFEVHLMVQKSEEVFEKWLAAGAKRIIVHLEPFRGRERELNKIFEKCAEENTETMLAICPGTSVDELFPFLDSFLFVQFLAVKPGFSGQHFDERVIGKIRFLKERAPEVTIEVDGGMNRKTAKLAKEAGAEIIASGSYIFRSKNPKAAYKELLGIGNEAE